MGFFFSDYQSVKATLCSCAVQNKRVGQIWSKDCSVFIPDRAYRKFYILKGEGRRNTIGATITDVRKMFCLQVEGPQALLKFGKRVLLAGTVGGFMKVREWAS